MGIVSGLACSPDQFGVLDTHSVWLDSDRSILDIMKGLPIFLALLLPGFVAAAPTPAKPALLPMPQEITWQDSAIPLGELRVSFPKPGDAPFMRTQLAAEVKQLLDSRQLSHSPAAVYPLSFVLGKVSAPRFEEEAYTLEATPEATTITANTLTGLYRGLQTLKQLIVREDDSSTIAACRILDYPAFQIRGFMHDVGRNFQSLDQLRMQIDFMASYKMNVFHWHLTYYYGWRLESKIYPGLQADESFSRGVGRYYTQEEFKEFIAYCGARGIRVIPEFDSPGHSLAFRKGIGVENMKDPKAKKAIGELIDELCTLAPKDVMPYIHIGTDEVRYKEEFVNNDYLPALHEAVQRNGREVIGWWKGMTIKGDTRQIQQTWAQYTPLKGHRHIDSRSNYVNHLEALDASLRMFFQQPCRQPHGDEQNLGGILCYWPDHRVDDEKAGLRISPVLLSMAGYSEAVWKGIEKDRPEFWAKVPPIGSAEFAAFADFEDRLAEHRDRFHTDKPFLFVKTTHIPWRLLGPIRDLELPDFPSMGIKNRYEHEGRVYHWTKPLHGGVIHSQHFFGFGSHLRPDKGDDTVWAFTRIHSDTEQTVDAWISFNTTSTSDGRAGVPNAGDWNANPACNIWINGDRVPPPAWKNPGKAGKEFPFTDEIYTNRTPSQIHLRKGWNTVLIKSCPQWKWCFSFTPILWDGAVAREVPTLRYATDYPD